MCAEPFMAAFRLVSTTSLLGPLKLRAFQVSLQLRSLPADHNNTHPSFSVHPIMPEPTLLLSKTIIHIHGATIVLYTPIHQSNILCLVATRIIKAAKAVKGS